MSHLQYNSSSSFATRTQPARPVSNTSSYHALDPIGYDTSDSRASVSDPSPTTPSLVLPADSDIFASRLPFAREPLHSFQAPAPSPSPQLSPNLDARSESSFRGPRHPGLSEYQKSEPDWHAERGREALGSPSAEDLGSSFCPSPSTLACESRRGSQQLKPLLLVARASPSLQGDQFSRPSSPAARSLRQLQLAPRSLESSPKADVDSGSSTNMLRVSSGGMDGSLNGSPRGHKDTKSPGAKTKGPRLSSRPLTAPNSPSADDSPASSKRFPLRYPNSRPQTSVSPRKASGAGDGSVPPGSSLLAARLIDGPEGRMDSESWKTPGDTDGDFIRRTYAHFSRAGVPGDGFAEGKEYTRERRDVAAWDEVPEWPAPNRSRAVTGASSANGGLLDEGGDKPPSRVPSAASMATLSQTAVDPPRSHLGTTAHSVRSGAASPGIASLRSNGQLRHDAAASPMPASLSQIGMPPPTAHSVQSSASEAGRFTSEEWQGQVEAEERKRAELIGKVDRYGFFSEGDSLPSHNRTILLPRAVFMAPLPRPGRKKDQPRPTDPGPADLSSSPEIANGAPDSRKEQEAKRAQQAREAADRHHRSREKDRIAKWSDMLEVTDRDEGLNAIGHDFVRGVDKRLRRRVYKGIPDIWRGAAWWALILRHAGTVEGRASGQKSKAGARDQHRFKVTGMRRDYAKRFTTLMPVSSPHDVQIDLDVPRTLGGHVQFHTRYGQGQRSLFHVLHAISLLCPDCGYCQGMGPIAATLLCYLSADQAYAAMAMLHHAYSLHTTFSPGFPGLVENFFVQNRLVKTYMPEIAARLEEQMVVSSAFATKWYITLFSNTVPFETQLRIWDAWLLEGQDVITLTAVAIIWSHRSKILSPHADFETILGALSGYFVPEDDDALLGWIDAAMQRQDVRQTMHAARKEWQKLVESGESSMQIL